MEAGGKLCLGIWKLGRWIKCHGNGKLHYLWLLVWAYKLGATSRQPSKQEEKASEAVPAREAEFFQA